MARPGRQSTIYGDASDSNGRGIVATLESGPIGLIDKAGVDPQQLDAAVLNLISMVDGGSALILDNAPMVEKLMKRLQLEVDRAIGVMEALDVQNAAAKDVEAPKIEIISTGLVALMTLAGKIVTILGTVDKMVANAAKSKDTVVRLRTFIATGDEKDRGLENMSENQLRKFINATANGEQTAPEIPST